MKMMQKPRGNFPEEIMLSGKFLFLMVFRASFSGGFQGEKIVLTTYGAIDSIASSTSTRQYGP